MPPKTYSPLYAGLPQPQQSRASRRWAASPTVTPGAGGGEVSPGRAPTALRARPQPPWTVSAASQRRAELITLRSVERMKGYRPFKRQQCTQRHYYLLLAVTTRSRVATNCLF